MGYFSNKDIADVSKPYKVSLANNPNFVVFSSKESGGYKLPAELRIGMNVRGRDTTRSIIRIKCESQTEAYIFYATHNPEEVSDNVFLVTDTGHDDLVTTLLNLRACLMNNSFLRNNYDIRLTGVHIVEGESVNTIKRNSLLSITALKAGSKYNLSAEIEYEGRMQGVADIAISFNDVPYSAADAQNIGFDVFLTEVFLRPLIKSGYWGTTGDSQDHFKVIVPDETNGITLQAARLATLKNLMAMMKNSIHTADTMSVELDEATQTLNCYLSKENKEFIFDRISTSGQPFISIKTNLFIKCDEFVVDFVRNSAAVSDTIERGKSDVKIELDVYAGTNLFLGQKPLYHSGRYVTTLSKSYSGDPLWFDLNSLTGKLTGYSSEFLSGGTADKPWCDAGTVKDYFFEARLADGFLNDHFYYSGLHFVVNGYNYALDCGNLEEADEQGISHLFKSNQNFLFGNFEKFKPLTSRMRRTHIAGQKQYFNFLLEDQNHKISLKPSLLPVKPHIGLRYKMYTQSGVFIGDYLDQVQDIDTCAVVNTAQLSLDKFLPEYTDGKGKSYTVGRIDVYLCRWHTDEFYSKNDPEVLVSTPMIFDILPQHLHKVNDFAFLNRLGGWDSMNFGGVSSSEFKAAPATFFKTLRPGFNRSSELEKVNYKNVQEQFTVQTSPITSEVVGWLREAAASSAVFELSTQRYVVVDDMTLKHSTKDDLFQLEMKYHYTDTFN